MAFEGVFGQLKIWNKKQGDELINFDVKSNPFLSGLNITVSFKHIPTINVSIDAPYQEGIELINSYVFAQGNLIAARIGYNDTGMTTPWYYGSLLEGGSGLEISPTGVSGTIVAQSVSRGLLYEAQPGEEGITTENYLTVIAEDVGYELDISPNAATRCASKTPWLGPVSNYEAIKRICSDRGLIYWIGLRPDGSSTIPVLYIYHESDLVSGTPVRKYVMRGKLDPSKNVWPILTYGPTDDKAAWIGGLPDPSGSGVSVAYYDDTTGKVVKVNSAPEEMDVPNNGYLADTTPLDDTVEGNPYDNELKTDSNAISRSDVAGVESGKSAEEEENVRTLTSGKVLEGSRAQNATITTIGSPLEFPGNMVLVRGCSNIFDGSYTVRGVTHTFAPGDFSTSIDIFHRGEVAKSGDETVPAGGELREDDPSV